MFDPIWNRLRFWRKMELEYKRNRVESTGNYAEYWNRQELIAHGCVLALTDVLEMLGFKNVELTD